VTVDLEQQRFTCEVRDIAKRPLDQRRMYLTEVEKVRGKEAADRLRAALRALWDEKKESCK
jgi:hypothetical protein